VGIKVIKTTGDRIQDVALSKIGDKGLFTKELEVAMMNGEADLAVHSLKDLPTEFPPGLKLGGVLPRHQVADALVARKKTTLKDLPKGAVVATSSLRRKAMLLHLRPDVEVIDIRGNVETRLKKLDNGHCDATIMAAAGLIRAGHEERITELLDPEYFILATSQGIIAMEIREDDKEMEEVMRQVTDLPAMQSALAERQFLHTLQGGCQVPIGCYTKWTDKFVITGFVASVDGKQFIRRTMHGSPKQAMEIAEDLAGDLLALGGGEILRKIRADESAG
jgi:hydroxymethylbilane synthase